jgi:hypothetical protein
MLTPAFHIIFMNIAALTTWSTPSVSLRQLAKVSGWPLG